MSEVLNNFIDTKPKIFVNILAYTNIKVTSKLTDDISTYRKYIFKKKFELPIPELKDNFDLEDYRLSANLKFNEYKKCKAKNKTFEIDKNIIANYKLIEQLIRGKFDTVGNFTESQIQVSFSRENNNYVEAEYFLNHDKHVLAWLCCCLCIECSSHQYFNTKNISYQINKNTEEWKILVEQWISEDSLMEIAI